MARYTMEVGKDFDKVLFDIATIKCISKAEVIRRAVASYSYFNGQLKQDLGYKVSITDDNNVIKDVILP